MKAKKKNVSFEGDVAPKQKQQSRIKKKHLLKKESEAKGNKGLSKWQGKPVGKKKFKKAKSFGDADSPSGKPHRKKSGKGFPRQKPGAPKSNKSHSKFQKKVSPRASGMVPNQGTSNNQPAKEAAKRTASEANLDEGNKVEVKKLKPHEMKTKERKKYRKQQNNKATFEMSMSAKKIWEDLRRENCPTEKKTKLSTELLKLIKGHIKQLIFAHDTVRVIECIVAVGNSEHRTAVFEEVKDDIVAVAKSKYAKFLLIKLLNYGTKDQKDFIIKSFKSNMVNLVRHVEAAAVVETAYNEYANAKQRAEMVQEFYGATFMVFKDEEARNLDDILKKHPEQKASIISNMKQILLKVTEKSVIRHSIVHYVLREFLSHADPQSRAEIIENIREAVVEILHTKDGSRVAMNCLWHGTVKDRKKVLKSMKMHVCKIAKEEHGSLVLIALFDCVDDTKLVQQIILTKLFENFMELVQDKFARRVLLYLVCPRDGHYFHPDVVNILKSGDDNEHSKKNPELRREELNVAASAPLLRLCSDHMETLIQRNATCSFVLGVLLNSTGSKKEVMERLSSLLSSPYHPKSGKEMHFMEQTPLHFLIKKLLQNEASGETSENCELFSVILTTIVPVSVMKTWIECNRGAYVLLDLLKSGIPSVTKTIIEVTTGLHSSLKSKNSQGAQLLLAELKKHSAS